MGLVWTGASELNLLLSWYQWLYPQSVTCECHCESTGLSSTLNSCHGLLREAFQSGLHSSASSASCTSTWWFPWWLAVVIFVFGIFVGGGAGITAYNFFRPRSSGDLRVPSVPPGTGTPVTPALLRARGQ